MGKKKEPVAEIFDCVTDGLKQLYRSKVRPIEELYRFGDFYSPLLTDGDFEAKPMVLLMGQYSVGKTSFIRYLLGRDFPGQHIGPEPTTDRFIAVMHGDEDKSTPGNALAVSQNMPFRGLEMFGNGFLSKFQGAQLDAPLLHHVTLIDTPGTLATPKEVAVTRQRQSRPPAARGALAPAHGARRASALRDRALAAWAPRCRPGASPWRRPRGASVCAASTQASSRERSSASAARTTSRRWGRVTSLALGPALTGTPARSPTRTLTRRAAGGRRVLTLTLTLTRWRSPNPNPDPNQVAES